MARIAIVGAGWMGIGCASVLLEAGHQVEIYERNDDIGGTWHPHNCYAGLTIHAPARSIEFPDFPLPSRIDRFERISSAQVHDYLSKYCHFKNLYKHMNFNHSVEKISYDTNAKRSEVTICNAGTQERIRKDYDYIIYTNGFVERNLPQFEGAEEFSGTIIHSADAKKEVIESLVRANKKVTILGGSKTAADFVLYFEQLGYMVDWVYRKNYWFFDYRKIMRTRYDDRGRISRVTSRIRCATFLVLFSVNFFSPAISSLLLSLFGYLVTYGKRHRDFRKFHYGRMDSNQIERLKRYTSRHGKVGEIRLFKRNGFVLSDGQFLKSDVVICCTGSMPKCQNVVDIEVDGKAFPLDQVHKVYRAKVIPEIPNVIFTAYLAFFLGTVNGINHGKWISNFIALSADEHSLSKHATIFEEPFFKVHCLNDSSKHFLTAVNKMSEPYRESGEISFSDYVDCIYDYYFGLGQVRPINFKMPIYTKK